MALEVALSKGKRILWRTKNAWNSALDMWGGGRGLRDSPTRSARHGCGLNQGTAQNGGCPFDFPLSNPNKQVLLKSGTPIWTFAVPSCPCNRKRAMGRIHRGNGESPKCEQKLAALEPSTCVLLITVLSYCAHRSGMGKATSCCDQKETSNTLKQTMPPARRSARRLAARAASP